MANNTTYSIYVPKTLAALIARYMIERGEKSVSKLVQVAVSEKLKRDGYQ